MSMATQEPHLRSHAIEAYAKAIYVLETRGRVPVSTTALAERLGVTAGSVSAMIKKLAELDLVTHTPYRGVRLTRQGRRTALEVIRHHRLLELFLAEVLEMPWDRVHQEAEVLEHVLSTELEEIIAAKLGNPTRDPHGDPIPSPEFEIEERETRSLADLYPRSEERRVGKECRSRWSPDHEKKRKKLGVAEAVTAAEVFPGALETKIGGQ